MEDKKKTYEIKEFGDTEDMTKLVMDYK